MRFFFFFLFLNEHNEETFLIHAKSQDDREQAKRSLVTYFISVFLQYSLLTAKEY